MLATITLYILLAACLLAMTWGILDAIGDKRALPRERLNTPWGMVARQDVRRAVMKMLVAVILCGAVLWSEHEDGAASGIDRVRRILHVRDMCALTAVALLTTNTVLEGFHRRRLRRRVAQEHPFPPPPREHQL